MFTRNLIKGLFGSHSGPCLGYNTQVSVCVPVLLNGVTSFPVGRFARDRSKMAAKFEMVGANDPGVAIILEIIEADLTSYNDYTWS